MKEKIYQYLKNKAEAVTTNELIRHFFHVPNSYPSQFEMILSSLLKDDPRFIFDSSGYWRIRLQSEQPNLSGMTFSLIDVESIQLSRGHVIPIALGVVLLKDGSELKREIFRLPSQEKYGSQLRRSISVLSNPFATAPRIEQHIDALYQELQNTILVSDWSGKKLAILNVWFRLILGVELELERLSLISLARLLSPKNKIKSLSDIAVSLAMVYSEPLELNARLDLMKELTWHFIHQLDRLSLRSWSDVKNFVERAKTWVNFSRYYFDQDFIRKLPDRPGVYFMKDRLGNVFYVGKAKNLRARVESYFINRLDLDEKGRTILDQIADLSYEVVGSELEALLLENHYINEYHPTLNTQLNVHSISTPPREKRRVIAFLPGLSEKEIVLFLAVGNERLVKLSLDREQSNWQGLLCELDHIFGHDNDRTSDYSSEQIEIFWRWFDLNQNWVNFINLEQCTTSDHCLELIKRYCADPQLFLEKIHYR
ncbi:MAG: nucleotide excision repair endonuclease [candidate division KSB1 bacterium]|nr:nucleotide excision repair endonuclease [candidate division KSB1 bacterium]MDZ7335351.1 nucleotide excision repair endonuclease [candidate division KSB1 bacterium]MDZ7356824.1 nucleotide excision repair endonuclease [candidate division KSB1 bacterium]MDZ7399037.1 nucleotide excision repair endonuclease [candidate division KSB1 bacterium]